MSSDITTKPAVLTTDFMLERLSQLSKNLLSKTNLQDVLEEVLQASVELLHADFGNIQLYDPHSRVLRIVAQTGFDEEFLARFDFVSEDEMTACGLALARGERVLIEDVEAEPDYRPYVEAARRAGYRSVQSTPLFGHNGRVLGVLSTHWSEMHRPEKVLLGVLDLYARQAADLIEREQHSVALQETISKLEQTSVELREANRIKDEFLGMVSHELRTPLSIIVGDARLLKNRRHMLGEADVETLLSDVADEALRLNNMIGHLLGIARSDMSVIQTEPLLLGRCVMSVVRNFQKEHPGRSIEMIIDDDLPVVAGDHESTQTVVENLLNNADKFCPPETKILLRVRHLGSGVMVSVRDRGEAVQPELLDRIFEPFFRSADPTRVKGLGLGLSLCRLLMQKQGGRIWARRRVGGGLSVSFWLPGLTSPY